LYRWLFGYDERWQAADTLEETNYVAAALCGLFFIILLIRWLSGRLREIMGLRTVEPAPETETMGGGCILLLLLFCSLLFFGIAVFAGRFGFHSLG